MTTISAQALQQPHSRSAFRTVRGLVTGYLGLSVLTLVAIFLLRDNKTMVTDSVWVRATIVVASALLTLSLAVRASRGSRGAFRRLRIVSGVMLVAIVVIVALPGAFPGWLRIEQGVCGLALLGVVLIVNGRHLRSLFDRAERA
jgi:heme/copper-type cytochrome/quinol oxidase subunit 4